MCICVIYVCVCGRGYKKPAENARNVGVEQGVMDDPSFVVDEYVQKWNAFEARERKAPLF